jgi:succinate dehydrogenase flavin-adding protein (antitoxin of CptAB toxin-antitoxin module)
MVALKEFITQELETLNEEQLRQVADFLAFLKFRLRSRCWKIDESQLATLYSEFAEEDQKLAEEGLDEYAELLRQEDLT